MAVHVLKTTQIVTGKMAAVWDFFSDARNLARITPPELGFTILSELPDRVYAGLMIEYRVRPLLGIPARWVTEITQVVAGQYFVDEQRVGPYQLWHHEHHFRDLGSGRVELRDLVTYILPFGPLGDLVHPFLVVPQLKKIFAYREKAVERLFR